MLLLEWQGFPDEGIMFVVGLTGGIGTGKGEVSAVLAELGADVIDADLLGHETYEPGTDGWREVVEAFGHGIVAPSGEIDRRKLATLVFADESARERLNRIGHPLIRSLLKERIRLSEEQGAKVVVVEAAILIEAGWRSLVDEVWVTAAPEDRIIERVQARSDLSPEAVRARMRSQMPSDRLAAQADAVIDNGSTLEDLRGHVLALWKSRVLDRKESSHHA